jgi:hypothetical protein
LIIAEFVSKLFAFCGIIIIINKIILLLLLLLLLVVVVVVVLGMATWPRKMLCQPEKMAVVSDI